MQARKKRRSQRVLLHVPVIVRALNSEGTRVEGLAFTHTINAHGGLLESAFSTKPGQELILVHPHSGKEAKARVVRVQETSDGSYPTAFEFNEFDPHFWHISFVLAGGPADA
jgi:hypothetical protein